VCSGNHDLEWDSNAGRWTPAYWLRTLVNPRVWTDGRRVALNGMSFLNIGATTRPKGGQADVWVVHAPPSETLVATRSDGDDAGDPDLVSAVCRYAPRVVLSGHVHTPLRWRELRDATLLLNPGCSAEAPFPNHILVHTAKMSCQLITISGEDTYDGEVPVNDTIDVDSAAAATVAA
jgi:hypothetical protein